MCVRSRPRRHLIVRLVVRPGIVQSLVALSALHATTVRGTNCVEGFGSSLHELIQSMDRPERLVQRNDEISIVMMLVILQCAWAQCTACERAVASKNVVRPPRLLTEDARVVHLLWWHLQDNIPSGDQQGLNSTSMRYYVSDRCL